MAVDWCNQDYLMYQRNLLGVIIVMPITFHMFVSSSSSSFFFFIIIIIIIIIIINYRYLCSTSITVYHASHPHV